MWCLIIDKNDMADNFKVKEIGDILYQITEENWERQTGGLTFFLVPLCGSELKTEDWNDNTLSELFDKLDHEINLLIALQNGFYANVPFLTYIVVDSRVHIYEIVNTVKKCRPKLNITQIDKKHLVNKDIFYQHVTNLVISDNWDYRPILKSVGYKEEKNDGENI